MHFERRKQYNFMHFERSIQSHDLIRSNKKTVLSVARPYLNLLVKPRFFQVFLEKYII